MTILHTLLLTLPIVALGVNVRVKRQDILLDDEAKAFQEKLCSGVGPGEWFRLNPGTVECRDVVQCTDAGLQSLRCPHGLAFDLERQTCNWKDHVLNCDQKTKKRKAKPNFNTFEPLCDAGQLACGDNSCFAQELFCDGKIDCPDESDEAACDINSDPNRATPCAPDCILPDCFCISEASDTPRKKNPLDIPQMILVTFDDAVNNNNFELYMNKIFTRDRLNPNGCSIKGTFFVSHKYTNYSAVEELFRQGHEIAVHSVSHSDSEKFWSDATVKEWADEMSGMKDMLVNFGNVLNETIYGMRAPYLRVGGNNQFQMMQQEGFLYDSTITAPLQNPPFWPYTLYHTIPHKCHGNSQNCPTRLFPAWEMVMNELDRREEPIYDENLSGCAMVDSCFSTKPTKQQFKNFLDHNFLRHYDTNRAPLGLFFHSAFLKNNYDIQSGFLEWMDEILLKDDVYFVTMAQVIQWISDVDGGPDPTAAKNYEPWKEVCIPDDIPNCYGGNNCRLSTPALPGETIHLSTCNPCPQYYPWVGDTKGQGTFEKKKQENA